MMTLLMSLLMTAAPVRAQSTATLRGLDVYRSAVLSVENARSLYGARLNHIVYLRNQHRSASTAKAEALRKEIEREAGKLEGVAYADLSISEYFTSVDHAMYITFDIVDEADRGRLAFSPAPLKTVSDPGGLLASWKEYYDLGSALARRGQMPVDRPDCPGFYCLWGAPTPELGALQKKMIAGVVSKERELKTVMAHEKDAEKRAAAVFLLSYGTRGEKVIEACLSALKDPSAVVRGAGLQILADIINHRKDLRVGADKIVPLLDDPSRSVRAKTLGLLVPMADDPDHREVMLAAVPRLLDILKMREPGSHDLAFTVLGQLSKKSHDRRDYASWEKWAEDNREGLKK
ncbi:MAG: hypothetical protein COV48_15060 [Elusimicrobia bacterium CG11_big_fil_rev_8_21_14_0_20_64_6]|nr:MAG: hypothetical protein COV48_15060 [Elusimicrobia bacterium CG11_big_fil_rev_8_21_14_0_20_64_6]